MKWSDDGHIIFAVIILLLLAVMAACLPAHAKDPVPNAPAIAQAEPQVGTYTAEQIDALIDDYKAGIAQIEKQIQQLQERRIAIIGAIQGMEQLRKGQSPVKEEKK